MATRRIVSKDGPLDIDSSGFTKPAEETSNITPAVPAHVIFKLFGFTLAMVIGPLGTYFLSLNLVFGGNSTWAGASAAIMANIVLMGYVIVAFNEDKTEQIEAAERESKKGK